LPVAASFLLVTFVLIALVSHENRERFQVGQTPGL
jgi:hypothetical protein